MIADAVNPGSPEEKAVQALIEVIKKKIRALPSGRNALGVKEILLMTFWGENRVGGMGLVPMPSSHTTVRTVPYTAVP
ncbi:hypothetical protein, partial [uncultured Sutterella sp.]|uniref:hypothetical protein n=3 Tax=uncultured Sutterella sp. TaxID=286133 RepID=UPI0026702816